MLANGDGPLVNGPLRGGAPVRAFLLGGRRRGGDRLAQAHGVSHKCRIPVGGVPMLERVLTTLEASPWVGETWLCIDDPAVEGLEAVARGRRRGWLRIVAPEEGPSASVARMWRELPQPGPVLVTTADHPLLEPLHLEHFLEHGLSGGADVLAGIVHAEIVRARYPQARRTFLKLGATRLTGANLFLLRTPRAARAVEFWREMESARKRPWRLAGRLGAGSVALYALGRLDLQAALARISARVGARAGTVSLPFAECALDVDHAEHLALVDGILRDRALRAAADPPR